MRRMLVIASILAAASVHGGEMVRSTKVFQAGEELQYAVRWKFIRLGTIIIRTAADSSRGDLNQMKITMVVESNPDIGVVDIREHNETVMDPVDLRSLRYRARHITGEECIDISSTLDQARHCNAYSVVDARTRKVLVVDTTWNVGNYVEGPSLLMLTRAVSQSRGAFNIPTLIDGKVSTTILTFAGDREDVDIDAIDRPVRTQRYTGEALWSGGTSAVLSGDFTGWLSDDEAAIPVKAELSVLIGSITLELESWVRQGWVPPTSLTASKD